MPTAATLSLARALILHTFFKRQSIQDGHNHTFLDIWKKPNFRNANFTLSSKGKNNFR